MKATGIRKIYRNRRGLTLVELITVIALLAIIATIALPNFSSLRKRAELEELHAYYDDVKLQAAAMVSAYNSSMRAGETPRFAGINISTARAMQECLRSANNQSELHDIVVTTVSSAPNTAYFNYIDTMVVCIQFFGETMSGSDLLITCDTASEHNVPCSPEFGDKGVVPKKCKLMDTWYIHIGDEGPAIMEDWN